MQLIATLVAGGTSFQAATNGDRFYERPASVTDDNQRTPTRGHRRILFPYSDCSVLLPAPPHTHMQSFLKKSMRQIYYGLSINRFREIGPYDLLWRPQSF